MKKPSVLLFLLFFLYSCKNSSIPGSKSFENVEGLLYFEPPETGSIVFLVFLPIKKGSDAHLKDLDFDNYQEGMKFITVNRKISMQLYRFKNKVAFIKGRVQKIYLIPNAKIYYHFENANSTNSLTPELQYDTLVYKNVNIPVSHYFNDIELDSIKIN